MGAKRRAEIPDSVANVPVIHLGRYLENLTVVQQNQ